MTDVNQSIDTFFEHYVKSREQLTTAFDAQWRSPCELGEPFSDPQGDQCIAWQPIKRHAQSADFEALERALEFDIHPDIKAHYGRYWSANLEAQAPDGHVSLLYLWNPEDVERLTENLIGHAVACRHNRTPFSVFFACTEPDSDLFLTVNNDTGQIMLEEPGQKPKRMVSENLATFMDRLVPAPDSF